MTDSFAEMKRELYELMQRSRRGNFAPPLPEGVTPSEARTIMMVAGLRCEGEDVRPGRVAEMTHTTPSALSQTFKTLEEKEEGERVAEEGRRLRDEHMDAAMAYVGVEEMQHLVRIMRKMTEFYEQDFERAGKSRAEGDDAPCA